MFRRFVLIALSAGAAAALAACGPSREEINRAQFEGFQAAREAGDIERAMSYLADDFRIDVGEGAGIDREHARDLLAWEAAVGARLEWNPEELEVKRTALGGTFTEHSGFYDLIGAAAGRKAYIVFCFDDDGRITRMEPRTLRGQIPLREKLNPFLDWMQKHEAEELAAIYPEGRIRYDAENAGRWLAALRRWRDDIRLP